MGPWAPGRLSVWARVSLGALRSRGSKFVDLVGNGTRQATRTIETGIRTGTRSTRFGGVGVPV